MPAHCLSFHARYRCRHAGACCEADWYVPVEPAVAELVETRGISRAGWAGPRFIRVERVETRVVAREADGTCVFFERDGGRLCAIHRHAGPQALPSACRHFPRVVLHDERGTFLSLSHFCPTAAVMLLDDGPVSVVEAAPPLLIDGLEGFEARGALPPLVRPGLLCDTTGYDAWERATIEALSRRGRPLAASLGVVAQATEQVREWRPSDGPLAERVATAFAAAQEAAGEPIDIGRDTERIALLAARERTRLRRDTVAPRDVEVAWSRHAAPAFPRFERAAANYLAARVFANRVAYEARGLRTLVTWLLTCLAVLRRELALRAVASDSGTTPADFVEAVRAADFTLVHVIDTRAFALACQPLEEDGRR
jgi:Fe-S-cluster containining protein